MTRWLVSASVVAAVVGAFLPGAGLGSSAIRSRGPHEIPAGLAAAIHSRFGLGRIRLSDSPTEHPSLGFAVALSADGTTALVSAPLAHNVNGAVFVYHVASAGSWASTATPVATLSGADLDALGWRLALSADGTTAFVGTPFGDKGEGAVFVYHVASEDAWASTSTKTATLTTDAGSAGQGLWGGTMGVSADGTTVVVGDWGYNNYAGGAEIYHVSSESAWVSTSTATATLSNAADSGTYRFAGEEVAMSGDGATVLVSDFETNKNVGQAYLFHAVSDAAWSSSTVPTAILSNASGVAHDFLGVGMALSNDGTTAFLGAPGAHKYRGAVAVFHVADAGAWASSSTPAAILTNGAGAANALLGDQLTVSADGATVVAGASGVNKSAGAAYVFHASGEGAWTSSAAPTAELTDSRGHRNDELGRSVAITPDGATVLTGVPDFNWSTGKADVTHVADAGSWVTSSAPTARLTNSALPKPLCVVPNLRRYPVRYAKEILGEANCTLGKVKRVHSTKKNRKKIILESPRPGRRLRPGSKVNLEVGK